MKAIEAIKKRRSVRNYLSKGVSEDIIKEIVDCARMAPTGGNKQSWIFVILRDELTIAKLGVALKNNFLAGTPVCIAVFCNKEEAETPLQDASAAMQNMMIAAVEKGLGSCWVRAYDNKNRKWVEDLLKAPREMQLMTVLAMGYHEEKSSIPRKKELKEIIRWDSF